MGGGNLYFGSFGRNAEFEDKIDLYFPEKELQESLESCPGFSFES